MQAEELVALRDESVASQNQEIDLAKFKILSIAVIGAIAIGTDQFASGSIPLVIGLIPPVAFYIDVIMETKSLQVMAIGAYLSTLDPERSMLSRYEAYCQRHRSFFMTNYAYKYSTAVVSGAIVLMGVGRLVVDYFLPGNAADILLVTVEIASGMFGLIATILLKRSVSRKIKSFFDAVEKEDAETKARRAARKNSASSV